MVNKENKMIRFKRFIKSSFQKLTLMVMITPMFTDMVYAAEKAEEAATNNDLAGKLNTFMNSIYMLIVKLTTVSAGTAAAVCLFLMFFSKSSKVVEESSGWLKRIVLCWAAIIFMSVIIGFINTNLGSAQDLTTIQ